MKQYLVYVPEEEAEQGPFPAEMIRNAYEQGIYSDTVMLRDIDGKEFFSINTVFAKAQPAVVVGNTPSDKLKPPAISITQTQQASSTKNNRQLIIGGAVALIAAVIFAVCFGSGGGTITREEAVRELRQAGVIASELDIQGRIGSMAMATACEQGNSTIVKLLLAGGITAEQLNNEEVLKIAVQNGHTEIVKLLLAAPGISPYRGYPLEVAASHGHTEIVKLLLAAPDIGVNDGESLIIEKTNRWGTTTSRSYIPDNCGPLIKAVKNNHIEIVRLLLATPGIDVNHKCQDGDFEYTPLMQAVADSRTEIVKLLLAAPGIDVDKQYRWGKERKPYYHPDVSFHLMEPLYYYEEVIYETALSLAKKKGNAEIIELLRAAGACE